MHVTVWHLTACLHGVSDGVVLSYSVYDLAGMQQQQQQQSVCGPTARHACFHACMKA